MHLGLGLGLTRRGLFGAGAGAGGGGGAITATHWRLKFLGQGLSNGSMARLVMKAAAGGSEIAGGTATASSTNTIYVPANALDSDASTFWATLSSTGPFTFQIAYGAATAVEEFTITPRNDGFHSESPARIQLEYSLDSGTTWTVKSVFLIASNWVSGVPQTFTCPTATGAKRVWGVWIQSGQSATQSDIATLKFRDGSGNDITSGGTAGAYDPNAGSAAANAFDGNGATAYTTNSGHIPYDALVYDWGSGNEKTPADVQITRLASGGNGPPLDFLIVAGDSINAMAVRAVPATQSNYSAGETRTFNLSSVLAPVAGRTFVPNEFGGGTNTWVLAETQHILMDDVTGTIELWWPNWRATSLTGSVANGCMETLPGAAATATAQLTYTHALTGVLTVVNLVDKTGGTTSLSASDGGFFKATVAINAKRGSTILPRFRGNFPNGMNYSQKQADLTNGDLFQFGSSVPSLATTPTNSYAAGLSLYAPCAILAVTSKRTVGIVGDSRESGLTDVVNDAYGHIGQAPRLVGRRCGYINVSIPGETAADFALASQSTRRVQLLQLCSDLMIGLGVNDTIFQGRSGAQAWSDAQAVAALVGKTAIYKTIDPVTVSNVSNTVYSAGNDPKRLAYNVLVRAQSRKFDAAAVLENGTTGTWNSLTYTSEGTHETNTGNAYLVANTAFDFSLLGSPALLTWAPWPSLGALLNAWHDASDASTVTIATGVSNWTDKGVKGNHATQPTGGAQPSYTAQGIVVSATTNLTSPVSASNDDEAVFGVANPGAVTSARTLVGPSGAGGRQFRFAGFSSDGKLAVLRSSTGNHAVSTTLTAVSGVKQVVGWLGSKNGTNTFTLNGTTDTSAIDTNSFTAARTTIIGTKESLGEPLSGSIHELIFLSANPTVAQRQQIEGYLAWKWGLQASLPGGHPFLSAAP